MITDIFIKTAGLGTRLRPFTNSIPKAAIPVLGSPVFTYLLDLASSSSLKKVLMNVHHLPELFSRHVSQHSVSGLDIRLTDEKTEILGSGGGIRLAAHQMSAPFFVLNGDTLIDVSLRSLECAHRKMKEKYDVDLTLAVRREEHTDEAYAEIQFDAETHLIRKVGEKKVGAYYFAGAAVLEDSALSTAPNDGAFDFTKEILNPAINKGRAGVFLLDNTALWLDVGTPRLWAEAHFRLMQLMEAPGALPACWRSRIEKINRRNAAEQWVNRNASVAPKRMQAPCYWSVHGEGFKEFGPRAVGYGTLSPDHDSLGIGLDDQWVILT